MMRVLMFGLAVLATACSADVGKGGAARGGGYSVEVRVRGNDQIYLVTGPDGRAVAARAHEGVSAILDARDLQQALAAMPAPAAPASNGEDDVSIRAPGFSLRVSGDEDHAATTTTTDGQKPAGEDREHGNVTMNIGGFGLNVNADDGGADENDDRAQVRLTGLSARDARKFITEADDLSPAVQSQMLTALGLGQDQPD